MATADEDDVMCTICLVPGVKENMVTLSCKHAFHYVCVRDIAINSLYPHSSRCPLCREDTIPESLINAALDAPPGFAIPPIANEAGDESGDEPGDEPGHATTPLFEGLFDRTRIRYQGITSEDEDPIPAGWIRHYYANHITTAPTRPWVQYEEANPPAAIYAVNPELSGVFGGEVPPTGYGHRMFYGMVRFERGLLQPAHERTPPAPSAPSYGESFPSL